MTHKLIGISIADSEDAEGYGFSNAHLKDTLVEFARYLLINDYDLAYGGHLQKQGYTNYLFDLVRMYKKELNVSHARIHSFLSWPFSCDLTPDFQSKYKAEVNFNIIDEAKNRIGDESIQEKMALKFQHHYNLLTAFDKYHIACSLYDMRIAMNMAIDARIAIGGKTLGFSGFMPGLLRESFLAIQENKPLFLIGAYGGCSKKIIDLIQGKKAVEFSTDYQLEHHVGYNVLHNELNKQPKRDKGLLDYESIVKLFAKKGVKGLNNGLSIKENEALFETNYLPKMINLVLKGLRNC